MARQKKAHARSPKLNVRLLGPYDNDESYVLIEGDKHTLRWFGRILIDHATGRHGCDNFMHPRGPGNKSFARTAQLGIYFHLLPCDVPTEEFERAAGRKWSAAKARKAARFLKGTK